MSGMLENTTTIDPLTSRLYRCYKVVHAMLEKRGYVTQQDHRNMTPQQFVDRFGPLPDRSQLTILVSKPIPTGSSDIDSSNNKLFVFFPDDEKVGVKPIKVYTDHMKTQDVRNAIMVLRQGITPFAKQAVQEMSSEYNIEHFREAELLVDITEHQLVPEHQVLTTKEKQELLSRYRLKEFQLPRIQPTDPVARYYGMKRGQIVKIIRPSETAGRYVTYRICI